VEAPNILDQARQASGPPGTKAPENTDGTPTAPGETEGVNDERLTAEEERELSRLQAKAQRAAAGSDKTLVRMRVEEPHDSLSFGGFTLGRDYQTVPSHLAGSLQSAAAEAGVNLTQEDQES
jgi:hypothetical protein